MTQVSVGGISLVVSTDDEVDQITGFLRAIGLQVEGEAGFAEISGTAQSLTVMRGAMVPTPPLGGVILQAALPNTAAVDAATRAAEAAGGQVGFGPADTDFGNYSAFVTGPAGLIVELSTPNAQGS